MAPARLHKQEQNNHFDKNFFCNTNLTKKVEAWCIKHASIIVLILFIVFLLIFVALCSALCGVSATESGAVYNQLNNIV